MREGAEGANERPSLRGLALNLSGVWGPVSGVNTGRSHCLRFLL